MLSAIAGTAYGATAVTYVEWAANTAVVVDWTRIDGPESAASFAGALLVPPCQAYGRNAIGATCAENSDRNGEQADRPHVFSKSRPISVNLQETL